MTEWNQEQVAARFEEAADTAERLPAMRSLSYFNIWPIILREHRESWVDELDVRFPPSPEAVERMVETNRWALWLEEEQRHLIWMRAQRCKWKEICARFGCERSTARRRWERALKVVVERLNDQQTVDSEVEGESNNS